MFHGSSCLQQIILSKFTIQKQKVPSVWQVRHWKQSTRAFTSSIGIVSTSDTISHFLGMRKASFFKKTQTLSILLLTLLFWSHLEVFENYQLVRNFWFQAKRSLFEKMCYNNFCREFNIPLIGNNICRVSQIIKITFWQLTNSIFEPKLLLSWARERRTDYVNGPQSVTKRAQFLNRPYWNVHCVTDFEKHSNILQYWCCRNQRTIHFSINDAEASSSAISMMKWIMVLLFIIYNMQMTPWC